MVFSKDDVIAGRYQVLEMVGQGGFGNVYKAFDIDSNEKVACKVSDRHVEALRHEANLLYRLGSVTSCIPRYNRFVTEGDRGVLVMKLLGPSMSQIRTHADNQNIPMAGVLRIAIAMNACLFSIHQYGVVHRDIKNSNFALSSKKHRLYLIDFGIARTFASKTGLIPARPKPGFRGSILYASPNAHAEADLGPRDDYWSLLFSLIELMDGRLPWKHGDGIKVAGLKKAAFIESFETSRYPQSMKRLVRYLQTVKYGELLDCRYVRKIFLDDLWRLGVRVTTSDRHLIVAPHAAPTNAEIDENESDPAQFAGIGSEMEVREPKQGGRLVTFIVKQLSVCTKSP
ncbi:Protein kinase domain [Carpediemonas membranifera]|uniref:Protein kinase domain n=1 Tax=Carpediemonas membranifera TaxID=201153 RepID=A0A8J6BA62_9EUKA|nr:Protein kinase domain [Carpediemonas membranifera]|eukprot:KAG9397339.1 Protein kinase domain [Carpediemonas membranifera]